MRIFIVNLCAAVAMFGIADMPAARSETITIPGTYTSPYTSTYSLASGDTLSILSDGEVTASGTAVLVSSTGAVSVSNAGQISSGTSSSSYGVQLQNGSITNGIVNSGTILAGRTAVGNNRGSVTNANFTVAGGITNTGVLRVTGFNNNSPGAIQLDNGFTVSGGITNGVGAIIESTGSGDQNMGIYIGSSGTASTTFSGGITNAGTIRAPALNAIRIATTGTNGSSFSGGITNQATGVISGPAGWGGVAVWGAVFNGNIDNAGLIEGPNAVILRLGSTVTGDVINRSGGTIQGTTANSIALNIDNAAVNGTVTNDGLITGGTSAANTGLRVGSVAVNKITGGISNSGMIRGITNSVNLLNPSNAFTLTNTGTLSGAAAIGINTLNLQGSAARVIGTTSGSATSVVNVSGTFASEGTFNVGRLNVAAGGRMAMNHNVTVGAGGFNNAGQLIVESGSSATVTGNNGGQFVTTGNLKVNGTLSGSPVSIQSTGTLSGSGTIAAETTVAGVHSPGNSPGMQTFGGSLSYTEGATVAWELIGNTTDSPGVNYDQIVIPTANLTFSGTTTLSLAFNTLGSTVNWADPFWGLNHTWTVFDLTGGTTTGFGNLLLGGSFLDSLGLSLQPTRGSFNTSLSDQDVVLNYVASTSSVPEIDPSGLSSVLALIAGALGLIERRRLART